MVLEDGGSSGNNGWRNWDWHKGFRVTKKGGGGGGLIGEEWRLENEFHNGYGQSRGPKGKCPAGQRPTAPPPCDIPGMGSRPVGQTGPKDLTLSYSNLAKEKKNEIKKPKISFLLKN